MAVVAQPFRAAKNAGLKPCPHKSKMLPRTSDFDCVSFVWSEYLSTNLDVLDAEGNESEPEQRPCVGQPWPRHSCDHCEHRDRETDVASAPSRRRRRFAHREHPPRS